MKRDKILVILFGVFFSLLATAGGEFITLPSGQVIAVPEGGRTCTFDTTYCFMGWKEDGSFPGVLFGAAVKAQLERARETGLDFPLCPDDNRLSVGGTQVNPFPCYELIHSADD